MRARPAAHAVRQVRAWALTIELCAPPSPNPGPNCPYVTVCRRERPLGGRSLTGERCARRAERSHGRCVFERHARQHLSLELK